MAELDDVIDTLRKRLARRWLADRPEATGELGHALLTRYERDAAAPDLAEATEHLRAAIGAAPKHPDRFSWYLMLGLGLGYAVTAGSAAAAELDQAIDWVTRARAGWSGDPEPHDHATVVLADLYVARFQDGHSRAGWSPDQVRDEVTGLVDTLTALTVTDPDSPSGWYLQMLRGAHFAARYEATGVAADLDRGVALLEEALEAGLPPTIQRIGSSDLAHAYLLRAAAHRDDAGDLADLDRAVALAAEVIRASDGSQPEWVVTHRRHAAACQDRWQRRRNPADLDQAIAGWRVVDEADPHWLTTMACAWLLWMRATAAADRDELVEAARYAERALRYDGLASDDLLYTHWLRLSITDQLLSLDLEQEHWPASTLARHREQADGAAAAVLGTTAGDLALRAELALTVAAGQLMGPTFGTARLDIRRSELLLALAGQHPDPSPAHLSLLDLGRSATNLLLRSQPDGPGATGLDRPTDPETPGTAAMPGRAELRGLLSAMRQVRTSHAGDRQGAEVATRPTGSGSGASEPALVAAVLSALDASWSGEEDRSQATSQIAELLARLPASPITELAAVTLRWLRSGPGAGPASADHGMSQLVGEMGEARRAAGRGDPRALQACAERLARRANEAAPGHIQRIAGTAAAGEAYLDLARLGQGDRAAAQQAVRWYEETIWLASETEYATQPYRMMGLAESLRLAGLPDRARTRALGRSALRHHAWRVLLQAGTGYALDAARGAMNDAQSVARWCLQDGAMDDLVAALDTGREHAVCAATASGDIPARLAGHGHDELARQWRETLDAALAPPVPGAVPGDVPDDLRLAALAALRMDALEPIKVEEIRTGLRHLGADALVYLLPSRQGPESHPGLAVVVPVAGPVDTVPLPDLTAAPALPTPRSGPHELDELCQWAWHTAVEPLIDHARRWRLRRPARLVVVPLGMLALVPWHAAYPPRAPGRRYAIEDAVITYSPSARMMCDAASKPARRLRSILVVGDPSGDLTRAGSGAQATQIQLQFYRAGAYFGQPGSAADAHLVLAGGQRPAASDLLETARRARLTIDTVFLAACATDASGDDYDGAFSLATAFLAAGARTVFASMWQIPASATSLLMYVVHHYLNAEGCQPAEALRRAQLWMVDPDRRPPDGMPDALVPYCSRAEVADPVSWAGFVHLGC